jgi:uridine kinase
VTARDDLLDRLAATVVALAPGRVARVGVDGVDGAGKTVFADELAGRVRAAGRAVIRASVDGFHRPRRERYRQGRTSPRGYVEDSYDYPRMAARLLDPLGPGGDGRYRVAAFDHRTDSAVDPPLRVAAGDEALIVDGIFLHHTALAGHWDWSVFLDVPFTASVARMAARDGSDPDPAAVANHRYVEGQRLYLRRYRPWESATVVVDNSDLAAPVVVPAAACVAAAANAVP